MAQARQLPCDSAGVCMLCKFTPANDEKLICMCCTTSWHLSCLALQPETLASALLWECPDCLNVGGEEAPAGENSGSGELVASIRTIEADESLTEQQKAEKRQELLSGPVEKEEDGGNEVLDVIGEDLKCSFCIQLMDQPVTTPCGHNFCLKCLEKWIAQGNQTCAKCRKVIPSKMASLPPINSTIVAAIRLAKMQSKSITSGNSQRACHYVHNQDRPDVAYTTDRAKRPGIANASSGRILVTIPEHHFGPILAEHDPVRNRGVLVGDTWQNRLEVRQWGVHFPHISGIAGQAGRGAQSVVLAGGYEDDEDHGDWFLYTGSGGRDLSGNKRTNKSQTFDQTFVKYNESLRLSCIEGYPVRVVRSCKDKHSSFAPKKGLRYDGIYRIETCWRKVGKQGFKVCRYLFVRCDNAPAPWTRDEHGNEPRFIPVVAELDEAIDILERNEENPSWGYDKEEGWRWKKPPPPSKKKRVATEVSAGGKTGRSPTKKAKNISLRKSLSEEFICHLCKKVLNLPVTTPCAHNFCKQCLEGNFAGQSFMMERTGGERTLPAMKNVMGCPKCSHDITDLLNDPQVNRELMGAIEKLESLGAREEQYDPMELTEQEEDAEDGETHEQKDADANPLVDQKRKMAEASDGLQNADEIQQEKKPRRLGRPRGGSKAKQQQEEAENAANNYVPKKPSRRGRPKGGSKAKQQEAEKQANNSPPSPFQNQGGVAASCPLDS